VEEKKRERKLRKEGGRGEKINKGKKKERKIKG
jgi:hypothetical protein